MKPHYLITCMIVLPLFAACTQLHESAEKSRTAVVQGVGSSMERVRTYLTYHPKDETPQLPQTRYCYQAAGDVICYMQPQSRPNLPKLAGFQDAHPNGSFAGEVHMANHTVVAGGPISTMDVPPPSAPSPTDEEAMADGGPKGLMPRF